MPVQGAAERGAVVAREPVLMRHEQAMERARRGEIRLSWKYPVHAGLRLREVATSLRQADYALLLNNYDCQYAIRKLGVAENRVGTYHPGIEHFFLGRPQPTPRGAGEALRVAQIGRYTLYKGAPYAAAALKRVMRRHREVSVTFLGTGCPPSAVLADFPADLRERVAVVSWYERRRLPALLESHHVKGDSTRLRAGVRLPQAGVVELPQYRPIAGFRSCRSAR